VSCQSAFAVAKETGGQEQRAHLRRLDFPNHQLLIQLLLRQWKGTRIMNKHTYLSMATLLAGLCASGDASADDCSNIAPTQCFSAVNSSTGYGINTSTIIALSNQGAPNLDAVHGEAVAGNGVGANGVFGKTQSGWPHAGVYGTSTSSTNPTGVIGIANSSAGTGVAGGTDLGDGVLGYATGSGGAGTFAIASGISGIGLHALCNGSCPGSSSGLAGQFDGNVRINAANTFGTPLYVNGVSGGGGLYVNGPAGGTVPWTPASDIRLKKDVVNSTYGLDQVLKLRPVTYKFKKGDEKTHVGLIAQEVLKLIPEVVRPLDNTSDMLGIEYESLVPVLVKAVQDQQKVIERQEARMAMLERGRAPVMSYLVPGGLGGVALGLVPLGFIAAKRWRKDAPNGSID
jgi:hypothetical protein